MSSLLLSSVLDLCPPSGEQVESANPLEPTIFHEPWWLSIATSNNYEVAEVSNGGKVVGRLPYTLHKRFGLTSVDMPMLTHFLGPAFAECEGKASNVFLKKLSITRELIQKLPSVSLIRMKMHHEIKDAVAFQEQGFRTSVQFTHEIEPLPEKELWANLRNKTRNVIRRAEEQTQVIDLEDPYRFMDFYTRNLEARGMRCFLDLPVCIGLIEESMRRGRGRIMAAVDGENRLSAANFYVWDGRSYYFLLTTRALDSGNGTTSLLLWKALQDASRRGLVFDSDGLNSNGGILFLAGLGGNIQPRYIVTKTKFSGRLLETVHETVWGKNYFVRG